jgi:hypothetical protein
MLQTFKAVPMYTLFLQGPDHALHRAVLLGAMRRDKLLLQILAPNQSCVGPAGEDKTVVRAQQEQLMLLLVLVMVTTSPLRSKPVAMVQARLRAPPTR